MAENSGGFWAVAAVPGVGIRRVWVSDEVPEDPGRAAARELERSRHATWEMSLAMRGDVGGDIVLEDSSPAVSRPDDPGGSFLSRFGRRGGR